jgi:chemotaxis protein CheD
LELVKTDRGIEDDALKTNGTAPSGLRDCHLEVAQRRLEETKSREDALEAIRDIVTNLLGSEEIALFNVEKGRTTLTLHWWFGIDAARHRTLPASKHPVLQRVIEGECYLGGAFEGEQKSDLIDAFNAFVPIRWGSQTVAVLAIRSLLPQKPCLDESDIQLLRYLSGEAGKTLFGQRLAGPASDKAEHL